MKEIKERLVSSLQKCDLHLERIHYANGFLSGRFPYDLESYQNIDEATIGYIDQLIFRFIKLQDEIGNHTFRFLLEFLGEDIQDKPFRDILSVLERLKVIETPYEWLSLRELRNDLTHEYPQLVDETIEKLNNMLTRIPVLEDVLMKIKTIVANYS